MLMASRMTPFTAANQSTSTNTKLLPKRGDITMNIARTAADQGLHKLSLLNILIIWVDMHVDGIKDEPIYSSHSTSTNTKLFPKRGHITMTKARTAAPQGLHKLSLLNLLIIG